MDWLNIHTSTLDSPEFVRCDPMRRATWLCLTRYCIGQENGGRIAGCRPWGDTTWQQLCRVKLREVNADSPLWRWEGEDLIVSFYPSEKEAEVRQNRENGRRGGRPRNRVDNHPVIPSETERFVSAETEGKGKEGEGKGIVTAAAPPPCASPAADPMGFDSMQVAPPRQGNFSDWRIMVAKRVFVGRDEHQAWDAMFEAEGWDAMTEAYGRLCRKHSEPKKLFLSMFQELRV